MIGIGHGNVLLEWVDPSFILPLASYRAQYAQSSGDIPDDGY